MILHGATYRHNTKNKNNMILTKRREQCLHGNLKCMWDQRPKIQKNVQEKIFMSYRWEGTFKTRLEKHKS